MDEYQSNGQEIIVQPTGNIVEVDGGSMFTTSLIVAQAFEKEHKDVLRASPTWSALLNSLSAILRSVNTPIQQDVNFLPIA